MNLQLTAGLILAVLFASPDPAQKLDNSAFDYERPCGSFVCRATFTKPKPSTLRLEGGYFDKGSLKPNCSYSANLREIQPGVWNGHLQGMSSDVTATFLGKRGVVLSGTQQGCGGADYGTEFFTEPGKPVPSGMIYRPLTTAHPRGGQRL